MKTIKYESFHPDRDENKTRQLVNAYIDIYAEEPWNEFKKCSVCGKYWGKKDKDYLSQINYSHCGAELEPYWNKEIIEAKLRHAISNNGVAYVALDGSDLIGFCFGYKTNLSDLKNVLKIDISLWNDAIDYSTPVAYQNDLALLSKYRGVYNGQKIAKELVRLRALGFLENGLQFGIVRTREFPKPSKTFIHYNRLGFNIIKRYPNNDGRVIMFGDMKSFLDKI